MNTFAIARVTKGSNVSKQTNFLVDEAPVLCKSEDVNGYKEQLVDYLFFAMGPFTPVSIHG